MASARSKVPPVGSSQWVISERRQANQFIEEEVEEFTFSVRNELEWLNEHMAEIYSRNNNTMNVTDVFKTPGKLRGKTPRTARKRNVEARAPLTDIFAPNPLTASTQIQNTQFFKQVSRFQVAEDPVRGSASPVARQPVTITKGKENADSGYYGNTQEEMEVDGVPHVFTSPVKLARPISEEPSYTPAAPVPVSIIDPVEERRASEESFVSAEEGLASKYASNENLRAQDTQDVDDATVADDEMQQLMAQATKVSEALPDHVQESIEDEHEEQLQSPEQATIDDAMDIDGMRSPSEGSSPVKPLVRKSSLSFAPLPGRETLVPNKSIGARVSRLSHVDLTKSRSTLGRLTGGKSLGAAQAVVEADNSVDVEMVDEPPASRENTEATKMHSKTSTQRLHDRINLLGQSKEPKATKEVPQNMQQTAHQLYPSLPLVAQEIDENPVPQALSPAPEPQTLTEDEEDDWIVPMPSNSAEASRPNLVKYHTMDIMEGIRGKSAVGQIEIMPSPERRPALTASPQRPFGLFGHGKSASQSVVPSMARPETSHVFGHGKAISISNLDFASAGDSTTPVGSPTAKKFDGPLSASKAKFFSVLKSAKEKLITGAGVSAKAKLETLSPATNRFKPPTTSLDEIFSPSRAMPGIYPKANNSTMTLAKQSAVSLSPSKSSEGRRTRSSSEREKRKEQAAKEEERTTAMLEKAREQERVKAASHHQQRVNMTAPKSQAEPVPVLSQPSSQIESIQSYDEDANSAEEMPPPPPPKSLLPTTQTQKAREPRRIAKPVKDGSSQRVKPPVIRVAINRFQPTPASASSAPPPKSNVVSSKPSSDNLKSSTTQPPRLRALEVAAQKKKEEEKLALRRAELKREQEQKRAARLEEDRQQDQQRRAAEQQRAQEARKAAQKQATEAKQRQQASRPQSRQASNLLQSEKTSGPSQHTRNDLGSARPMSRLNAAQEQIRPAVPQVNPAKPPKRAFQTEEEEPIQRSALQRAGPPFQTLDSKRRRTLEEDEQQEDVRRSVMAPPVRQSIRKEPTKFTHGYMAAPHPGQHGNSLLIKTVTSQHNKAGHPNEMARFTNAKIPFAEAPNPPAGPSNAYQSSSMMSTTTTITKTPLRPAGPSKPPKSALKSSPAYPTGDNIALPEITTDSEDEGSDNEFRAPSWVDSPALRDLLSRQQLVDPEQIFGPIPPLHMEEIFKNKERQKRFRDRTSSAVWLHDRLTEEERQADREAREKLMENGGWTFSGGK